MSTLIDKALKIENEEREAAQVRKAQTLIRDITSLREQRASLAEDIADKQEELRKLEMPEALADNVLGS